MECVVHIGTEKTGTTSIQKTLDANAGRLEKAGIVWPPVLREGHDTRMICYVLDDETDDLRKRRRKLTTPEALERFRGQFEDRFRREIRRVSDPGTVLIVNEHLSRIRKPGEVARLRDFLARFFDSVRIVVYLRRQDRLLRSMYSQIVKVGSTRENVFPDHADPLHRKADFTTFNYRRITDLWAGVFGREALTVRVFERKALAEGDVVKDFFQTAGIAIPEGFKILRTNESLSPEAILTLRAINRHLPRKARGALGPLSGQLFSGSGMPVERAAAVELLSHFQADNDYVARTYLGREQLFDPIEDGEYPETVDAAALEVSPETMAWHFARLWESRSRKV